jgi:hypothetical protein
MGGMSASDAAPLPRMGEVFFDVRGSSRSMRLSWYADTGVAVFSIWQGGMCTGTFRLPMGDLPRMVETLRRGPGERPARARPASRSRRARGAAEPDEPPDAMFRPTADSVPAGDWAADDPGGYPAGPGAGGEPLGYPASPGTGSYPAGYRASSGRGGGSGPGGGAPGYAAELGPGGVAPGHAAERGADIGRHGYAAESGAGGGPPDYPAEPAGGDSLGYRGQPGDPLDYRSGPRISSDPLDYPADPYPATGSTDYPYPPAASDYPQGPSSGDSWEQYGLGDGDRGQPEGAQETFPPRPPA